MSRRRYEVPFVFRLERSTTDFQTHLPLIPPQTHTHTTSKSQVTKKVPPKEVPGFIGAFTQTHTNTLQLPERARRMRMSETPTRTYEAPKSEYVHMWYGEVASNRN